jgi:hypothetical protein
VWLYCQGCRLTKTRFHLLKYDSNSIYHILKSETLRSPLQCLYVFRIIITVNSFFFLRLSIMWTVFVTWVISGYRREVAENCTLQGHYAAIPYRRFGTSCRSHPQDSRIQNQVLSFLPPTLLMWVYSVFFSHRLEFPRWRSVCLQLHWPPYPLHPTTCNNRIGWHHTTETFHSPHSFLYKLFIEATSFLLVSWTLRKGPIYCPETSVQSYHYSLRNNAEEYSSQFL